MGFDEDMDVWAEPGHSSSFTSLKEYCSSDYWKEEAERFRRKRRSFELDGETGLERIARHEELVSDSWVVDTPACLMEGCEEEELSELQDAYRSMSRLTAEYLMMERAAAKYSRYPTPALHQRPLPILVPGGSKHTRCQGVSECKTEDVYLPKPNFMCTIFKESTLVCREWLLTHYECHDGVSIPRSAMYSHYLDFCAESHFEPLNPAGFGKAVRSIFVNVQTRRLGNRGASKYHYYGLSIKASSPYHSIVQGTQRVNNLHDYDVPMTTSFHPRTVRLSEDGQKIRLEGFPSVISIPITGDLRDKVREFLSLYRCHAELVVELIVHTDFTEVRDTLIGFWTNQLPSRLKEAMTRDIMVHIVQLCDLAMYRSLAGMLIPNMSDHIPSSLLSAVRDLTDNLVEWTRDATEGLPAQLQGAKLTAANEFRQQMSRQCVLCHLIQGVKVTLRDQELMRQMLSDWQTLDLQQVAADVTERTGGKRGSQGGHQVQRGLRDFERLLSHRAPLDKFFMLVNNVLHNCSALYIEESDLSLDAAVSRVLLNWNLAVSVILREFTNKGTGTFGSFHLLGLLLTDYMLYLVEDRRRALREVTLKDRVYAGNRTKGSLKSSLELVLSDFKPIAPKQSWEAPSTAPASHVTCSNDSTATDVQDSLLSAVPVTLDGVSDVELSGIISQISAQEGLTAVGLENPKTSTPCGKNWMTSHSETVGEDCNKASELDALLCQDNKKRVLVKKNISTALWDGLQPSCSAHKPSCNKDNSIVDTNLQGSKNCTKFEPLKVNDLVYGITNKVFQEGLENQKELCVKSGGRSFQGHKVDRPTCGYTKHAVVMTNHNVQSLTRKGGQFDKGSLSTQRKIVTVTPKPSEQRINRVKTTPPDQMLGVKGEKNTTEWMVSGRNVVNTSRFDGKNVCQSDRVHNKGVMTHLLETDRKMFVFDGMDTEPASINIQSSPMEKCDDLPGESEMERPSMHQGHGFEAFKEEILQETNSAGRISQVCVQEELSKYCDRNRV